MIRKILIWLGIIKPFTHKPEDFKLKIVPRWAGTDFVCFTYTANGGRNWKYIYEAKSPFLDKIEYDWSWNIVTRKLGRGDFKYEKEEFGSYQKILDFEKSEAEKIKKGNLKQEERRIQAEKERAEALKRANL